MKSFLKTSLFALMISFCLLFSACSSTPPQTPPPPAELVWDGTSSDTSWYNSSEGFIFEISTPNQFAGFAELALTKDFSTQTINIIANINLGNHEWESIGKGGKNFKGTLNGNNHTISNIAITSRDVTFDGIFYIIENATIKNLNVSNINITGDDGWVGVLTGRAINSLIENCNILSGKIDIESPHLTSSVGVGGIAEYANGSIIKNVVCNIEIKIIENCEFIYIAGIVGELNNSQIENCEFNGSITGTNNAIDSNKADDIIPYMYVGGIAGVVKNGASISNCTNNGNLIIGDSQIPNRYVGVGGIAACIYLDNTAETFEIELNSNTNNGNFIVEGNDVYVGGIVGESYSIGSSNPYAHINTIYLTNNSNTGNISIILTADDASDDWWYYPAMGGIIGWADILEYNILSGNTNTGTMTGSGRTIISQSESVGSAVYPTYEDFING